MKIAIAGFGFVGQAVFAGVKDKDNVVIYDPPKGYRTALLENDVIICCLPTPTIDGKQDFSIYKNFLQEIQGFTGILVIKSTVLFDNIKSYLSKFRIVMNPEFLNQNSAIYDFLHQKVIILGGDTKDCFEIARMYEEDFEVECDTIEILSHEEAINFKYLHNLYHAYKVLFWNYVQEVTGNSRKYAPLYKKLREGMDNEMSRVCADGLPGFGGACFPKDMAAQHQHFPHELTRFMIEYNHQLRGE